MKARELSYTALLVASAIILGLFESLFPPLFTFAPGAKLGLANLITVIAMFTLSLPMTFLIILIRVLANALIGGTLFSLMYSLTGGIFSFLVMLLVKQLGAHRVSIIGISIMGGISHNFGQLTIASLVAQSLYTYNYLPFMSLAGIIAGFFVGLAGNYILIHIEQLGSSIRIKHY